MLADVDARGDADAIYHLGDLVGYSGNPNEVVARLSERSIAGIAGNYVSTVATDYRHCGCKSESPRQEELAHLSYEYTRGTATPATKRSRWAHAQALPQGGRRYPLRQHRERRPSQGR